MKRLIVTMLVITAGLAFVIWHEHMFGAQYVESCVDGVTYLKFARGGISPKYTPDGRIAVCGHGTTEKSVP